MLIRELFESILVEYNREKTAATFGNKLLKALMTDRSILRTRLVAARTYLIQKEKNKEPIGPNERQAILTDLLGVIESGDPTQHKEYSQWLVKCYANEDIILEDIISKGRDWLEVYDEMKRRKILPAEYRNIMNLKFNDLYGIISNQELVAKLQAQSAEANKGSSKVVLDNNKVRIIQPHDQEAACYYGQGTTWCTAAKNNNMYDYYAKQGDLYILLPKQPQHDGEKYQVHFQSNQFMDESDDPVDMKWLLTQRFGDLVEFFKSVEPEIGNYIQFADPNVVNKVISEIKEKSMEHVDEILNEWQLNDDYFYDWLRDSGYEDEDGDIDWDRVANDGIEWMEYNDEARRWRNKAMDALSPSLDELSDAITDYFDYKQEYPTITDLDYLIAGYVESEFHSSRRVNSDAGLSEWIKYNIIIKPEGDGYRVKTIHEK